MWLALLLIVITIALFFWNRKQLAGPRNRWNDFAERLTGRDASR